MNIYGVLNINELNIDEIKERVSEQRIERSHRYKSDSDKLRSVAVEYLLNSMIEELFPNIETPVILTYDEHGKPHIYNENNDDIIYFSLSHSGDYVACIISNTVCGIDIERHSDRDYEKIAKRICTDDEKASISDKNDFYNIWTLKESALKAVGLGLSLDMRNIHIDNSDRGTVTLYINNEKYYGQILDAPEGYSLSYVYS